MPVLIAVPKESVPGERRVGINPEVAKKFAKLGATIVVESGVGATAGSTDKDLGEVER
jgi:NAD(P) transhydrogenase subunit alpha